MRRAQWYRRKASPFAACKDNLAALGVRQLNRGLLVCKVMDGIDCLAVRNAAVRHHVVTSGVDCLKLALESASLFLRTEISFL